jgi:uncharacterized protein YndB with AHSA1/START domain
MRNGRPRAALDRRGDRRHVRRRVAEERDMALITRSQTIDRRVEDVFDVVADAGNFAAWNPTIKASRRLDDGELGDGSRFEWQLRGFGNVVQEFEEFERNKRLR